MKRPRKPKHPRPNSLPDANISLKKASPELPAPAKQHDEAAARGAQKSLPPPWDLPEGEVEPTNRHRKTTQRECK